MSCFVQSLNGLYLISVLLLCLIYQINILIPLLTTVRPFCGRKSGNLLRVYCGNSVYSGRLFCGKYSSELSHSCLLSPKTKSKLTKGGVPAFVYPRHLLHSFLKHSAGISQKLLKIFVIGKRSFKVIKSVFGKLNLCLSFAKTNQRLLIFS